MNMKNLPGWTSSNFLSFGFLFAFLFIYYLLGWFMVGTSLIVCCISMNLYFAAQNSLPIGVILGVYMLGELSSIKGLYLWINCML